MQQHRQASPALIVSAIGVVFGDIGTSPLYALKEIFNGHHPIPVTPENILGVLSLIFWSNPAAAYGIVVTGTMMIDTLLIACVMILLWRWSKALVALVAGSVLVVDLAFFAANAIKIPERTGSRSPRASFPSPC